ncbi:hypothetical protein N183_36285 [Sinorhizobium sp. Sb3]|nr:hypothetical protein N183_36285 [Sinorhizobium sp. Sb3]
MNDFSGSAEVGMVCVEPVVNYRDHDIRFSESTSNSPRFDDPRISTAFEADVCISMEARIAKMPLFIQQRIWFCKTGLDCSFAC